MNTHIHVLSVFLYMCSQQILTRILNGGEYHISWDYDVFINLIS